MARASADSQIRFAAQAFLLEVAFLLAASFCGIGYRNDLLEHPFQPFALIALTALAMGTRNAAVRKLAIPDLTTTVLTLTITGIGADSSLANGSNPRLARRVAAVAAMFCGAAETEVQSVIQQIALEHRRRYGYRRITAELRRRGMQVNHKRVVRIMRKDNLLALQPKCFKVTTNSNHKFEIYLNLAARMKLTGINQLWVADITYIRLKAEFVYLAVILDVFSRKVVGWALDRTLAMRLTVGALEQAIERRQPKPGLVHHSDRGLQYARGEYIAILEKYHMIPSMSRPANPYDNASCESFMKTLKREEIYAHDKYDDLEHLRANIEEFIEEYYNRQRLHSALGYRPPEEFEQQAESQAESRSATMVFFENKENNKKISKGLLGKGTQMPSPSPDPFSC